MSIWQRRKKEVHISPYNSIQIDVIRELASNILQRYLDISPTNAVGYSDIEKASLDWAWFDYKTMKSYFAQLSKAQPPRTDIIKRLDLYG